MKEFYLLVVNNNSRFESQMKRGLAYKVNQWMLQPLRVKVSSLGFNVTFDTNKHLKLRRKYEL